MGWAERNNPNKKELERRLREARCTKANWCQAFSPMKCHEGYRDCWESEEMQLQRRIINNE